MTVSLTTSSQTVWAPDGVAGVGLRVTTSTGAPLPRAITVRGRTSNGTAGAGTSTGTGGVVTLPKGPTGAPAFPRGATGGWTVDRKPPAPPPPAPLTWTPKGGVR